jgi:hypothetical protein
MYGWSVYRRDHGDQRTCSSTGKNANPQGGFDARVARFRFNHHPPILLNGYPLSPVSGKKRRPFCLKKLKLSEGLPISRCFSFSYYLH